MNHSINDDACKVAAGVGRKSPHRTIEDSLFKWLSDDWCGSHSVPLDGRTLYYIDHAGCDHVVSFLNDAYEIGFGYPDKWCFFARREDFHRIIRWYLRLWIIDEWCGLRRWVWYKLLHRQVRDR